MTFSGVNLDVISPDWSLLLMLLTHLKEEFLSGSSLCVSVAMVTALHINCRLISRAPKVPTSGFDTGLSEEVIAEPTLDVIVEAIVKSLRI